MGLFGFLKAPARFIERITGERASRQKARGAMEQFEQQKATLARANAQSTAQQKRLQEMLEQLSGLDRQQQSLHRDYKAKLRRLESEESHLKSLGQHYSKTVGEIEARGSELLSHKSQLEERSARLAERAAPLEQKMRDLAEGSQNLDGAEIQTLVEQYQNKFREAEASKERLKGLSRETSPELFLRHEKMVKALEPLHKQTESMVKSRHAGLSEAHRKIALELNSLQKSYADLDAEGRDIRRGQEKLERKKQYINTYQNILEPELKKFAEDQEAFQAQTQGLKDFQEKVASLEQSYAAKKGEAEALQKELTGTNAWQNQLVSRLNALQQDVQSHAQRYQERAGRSALIKGGLAGLATLGAGSALGLGSGLKGLAAGLSVFGTLNSVKSDIQKNLQRFGVDEEFSAEDYRAGGIPDWIKTPLNRVDFKSRVFDTKIKMPEFGELAQSIKHFEMPTLPTLAELPHLSEALGKIRSSEDIANLGILPGNTARSPNRSLLNPQLMQTFGTLLKSKANENKKGRARRGSLNALPLPRSGGLPYGR
jgi:chromosome segregation ATPase